MTDIETVKIAQKQIYKKPKDHSKNKWYQQKRREAAISRHDDTTYDYAGCTDNDPCLACYACLGLNRRDFL